MAGRILIPRVCFRATVVMVGENKITVRQTLDLHGVASQDCDGYELELILSKGYFTYPDFEIGKKYSFVADVMAAGAFKHASLRWSAVKAKEII